MGKANKEKEFAEQGEALRTRTRGKEGESWQREEWWGGGGKEKNWQVKNSFKEVSHLANVGDGSLEGNCQSGLPEAFLHFYFWQTVGFRWFSVTVSGTTFLDLDFCFWRETKV